MEIIKHGGHLSLEPDETTARIVHDVLADIRNNGIEAIRKYSRQFDSWDPPRFELS
jgi:histidinol dehydrogenase